MVHWVVMPQKPLDYYEYIPVMRIMLEQNLCDRNAMTTAMCPKYSKLGSGKTALCMAAFKNLPTSVGFLLEFNCDPFKEDTNQRAAFSYSTGLATLLIQSYIKTQKMLALRIGMHPRLDQHSVLHDLDPFILEMCALKSWLLSMN